MTVLGSRFVNKRPTFPARYLESRCVEGWYSSSGLVPRAFAITFVLPKNNLQVLIRLASGNLGWGNTDLLSANSLRTSLRYVLRMFSTEKTKQYWY